MLAAYLSFDPPLAPLISLHKIGASGWFGLRKQGKTCIVHKGRADLQLRMKMRAVLQLAQKDSTEGFAINLDIRCHIDVPHHC